MIDIAILSSNFATTKDWIEKEYQVKQWMLASGIAILVNDQRIKVINNIQDCFANEFKSYRKAPDYDSLEDYLKTRIR